MEATEPQPKDALDVVYLTTTMPSFIQKALHNKTTAISPPVQLAGPTLKLDTLTAIAVYLADQMEKKMATGKKCLIRLL